MGIIKRVLWCSIVLSALSAKAYDYERHFDAREPDTWPVIAIIIDDLGNQYTQGKRAIALPGPVAYAVLPHTPYGSTLAGYANARGKEVMLHQPLQASTNNHLLGVGAITLEHSAEDLRTTLRGNLANLPHVVGVNNHMGSLLTTHPEYMRWFMQTLKQDGSLFFVDSATSSQSVALGMAAEHGVPSIRRDVFLDSKQDHEAIAVQFDRLKQHARKHRFAVGIGHPFPETLGVLEKELPRLSGLGYHLVSIQDMIDMQSSKVSVSQRDVSAIPSVKPYQSREQVPARNIEVSP